VAPYPAVKRQGREIDHPLPPSPEVKSGEAISPFLHMSLWYSAELITHRDNFDFTFILSVFSKVSHDVTVEFVKSTK
jgi:hypothetical protein